MNAHDLEQLIRNRFAPPVYAFLPHVRNQTGYSKDIRTADALAMCLYPSRGLYLNGFEIKVCRSDWLVELKNPDKAEDIAYYCDFWWVVAPKDVVKTDEVPVNWGLMNPFGQTLKIIKQAKQLKSNPLDKVFVAAILRRAVEYILPDVKINAAYKNGYESGRKSANESFDIEKQEHRNLEEVVKKFYEDSGVNINNGWNKDKIGNAVKMIINNEHLRIKDELNSLLNTAERIVAHIKEMVI